MNCDVIKDLIPLYIDGCCSEESEKIINEHIGKCDSCRKLTEDMKAPPETVTAVGAPVKFSKLNDWKASVLQSVLLFVSFGLITVGVAFESQTPNDLFNGFCAMNLVVPTTGFMLSLANWYFVRLYKNRKTFSSYSLLATAGITLCAYLWTWHHYELDVFELLAGRDIAGFFDVMRGLLFLNGIGFALTVVFCVLSKILSNQYAKMLGKE